MVNTLESGPREKYCGRLLHEPCSASLQRKVREQVSTFYAFDRITLPIMPYIAAWRLDQPGIWYEYVGHRFLSLFACGPDTIATTFCNAILDRREYTSGNEMPTIREVIVPGQELDRHRPTLRGKTSRTGTMEAVYKVRLPDGRIIWLKDWAAITTFDTDRICLSPGYLTDISMEMEQKDQLSERNAVVSRDKNLLVEAERFAALGQISAQVYHEIKNPVLSIGGLARRLLKRPTADPHLFLEVIAKEAERLEKILHNLFDFTRPIDLRPECTNPVRLVQRVLTLLQSDFEEYGITPSLTITPPISEIWIDPEQICIALMHIIKNGIEAMIDGGQLDIGIRQTADEVVISIRDSGSGIHAVHKKRVTEPFFTTKVYGTGLGLSLAQKAVRLHQGDLVISPLASGGTVVDIRLPLVASVRPCGNDTSPR